MDYLLHYYSTFEMRFETMRFDTLEPAEREYYKQLEEYTKDSNLMEPTLYEVTQILPPIIKQRIPIRRT